MPIYDIWTIGASSVTVSSGLSLSGFTQGEGYHLLGETITFSSINWETFSVDDDDSNFGDSDNTQHVNGAQTFDGVTYTDGLRVEAEYSFVVTDGTTNWTLIAFNVNEPGSPYGTYGTIEGIAFIDDGNGVPPAGVALSVISANEGPSYPVANYLVPPCFVRGTLVTTPSGPRAVEDLAAGDLVCTRDHGLQPVLWSASRSHLALGKFAPVHIEAGILGNRCAIQVSGCHRLVSAGWQVELLTGQNEAFVHAKDLIGQPGISRREGGRVSYHHVLLPQHALLDTQGMWSESFYPGDIGRAALTQPQRGALEKVMATHFAQGYGPLALPMLRGFEAQLAA